MKLFKGSRRETRGAGSHDPRFQIRVKEYSVTHSETRRRLTGQ